MQLRAVKSSEILLIFGVPLVTLTLTRNVNFDPTNLPKLLTLATVGFGVIFATISVIWQQKKQINFLLIFISLFLLGYLLSLIFASGPLEQKFYGVYGRNTGFLAYLSFAFILISAATYKSATFHSKLRNGLFFAFAFNVIHSGLQLFGIDFVGWNNFYNKILGTFGNPDFISAFLAIGITSAVPIIFARKESIVLRIVLAIFSIIAFVEIIFSKAIQGLLVLISGVGIYLGIVIYQNFRRYFYSYLAVTFASTFATLLGILQIGPLSYLLYKNSVSLRGFYWDAGIKMFIDSPLIGIGPDSYGDWYQRMRSEKSIMAPGSVETITNSAHNVFIDILASAGILSFLGYLAIAIYTLFISIRYITKTKSVSPTFTSLFIGYVAYLLQSVVSINQIGLAVWGWVLPGAIYSYISFQGLSQKIDKKSKNDFSSMFAVTGCVLGFFVAYPAWSADAAWRSAFISRDINKVIESSKRWPLDSRRLAEISLLFDNNKLYQQSNEVNKIALEFNPDYFDAWRGQISNPLISLGQAREAELNLNRIDPFNPKWK